MDFTLGNSLDGTVLLVQSWLPNLEAKRVSDIYGVLTIFEGVGRFRVRDAVAAGVISIFVIVVPIDARLGSVFVVRIVIVVGIAGMVSGPVLATNGGGVVRVTFERSSNASMRCLSTGSSDSGRGSGRNTPSLTDCAGTGRADWMMAVPAAVELCLDGLNVCLGSRVNFFVV